MSNDFSDAPLTVAGVTVKPTWPWSPASRAEVAEGMRQSGKGDLTPKEIERRYVAWYADQHGLSLKRAREKIERVEVVR